MFSTYFVRKLVMPKIKQGRRHHHSYTRQKCYERVRQTCSSEPVPLQNNNSLVQSFEDINMLHVNSQLLKWHGSKTNSYIELSFLEGSAPSVVKFSVTVSNDLRWKARVYGRLVPDYNVIFDDFPCIMTSSDVIILICKSIENMYICEGNSDDLFIDVLKSKGGVIKKDGVISAYYDENSKSIYHSKCELLRSEPGKCAHCCRYRATLRAMKSRMQRCEAASVKTSHSSHANFRYLRNDELQERLRSTQTAKRAVERNVARLNEKLKLLIDRDGIDLAEEDVSEFNDLVDEVDETVKTRSHFQKIFWDQQRAYNNLHNKRSMRWHPLMIRFALNLKYLSSGAYRAVSHFLALPSNRTLCDYTHVLSAESGVSHSLIERLKKDMNFDSCAPPEKLVSIMLDEMKIKSELVFNRSSGRIIGFVNLGSINSDLEALQASLDNDYQHDHELAGSMLVLMVRLLRRPSFAFPVAQYPTSSLSGEKLYPILWDVIEALD